MPKPKALPKGRLINFRVSDTDYTLLTSLAAAHDLSISDFIRARAGLPVRYRRPVKVRKEKPPTPPPEAAPTPPPKTVEEPALSLASLFRR
jgi:hypothetical protein